MTGTSISIVIIVVIAVAYFAAFNALVSARTKVHEAWSGIDVQLKRRHDLIPNLVQTVKGYAKHERELLELLSGQRSKAITIPASNKAGLASAESALTGTVRSVIALAEAYPDLKANQNFQDLQRQLSDTEDQIAAARKIYNSNVQLFNTRIASVPTSIVASIHHFRPAPMFHLNK